MMGKYEDFLASKAIRASAGDERKRESIKAKKLPEDHGPLFGGMGVGETA